MTAFNPHEYLNTFTNFESQLHKLRPDDFNLQRIVKFLGLAGDPAKDLKIIHVAGTKGKGSTCAFLASILQAAGYKVGLYTSPHFYKVNERIRILDAGTHLAEDAFAGSITDEELGLILNSLRPCAAKILNEGHILTYFEVLTVAALCHFERSKADIVILETGLGGRLDATNAVDSLIAVITPVSLDHTKILGETLKKIASEKAGIIKNSHQGVVIAPQEGEVMELMLQRCREFGVHPVRVDPGKYTGLKIGLRGKHQMINAATAVEVVTILRLKGFKISDGSRDEGLKNVQWPGRFELLRNAPDLVVDCAHNEASSKALAETMREIYPHQRVILVLGISQDKDMAGICKALKKIAAHIILTKADHPRAHSFKQAECKNYFGDRPFQVIDDLAGALHKALQLAKAQDVILVAGSIFVVAEASAYLAGAALKSARPKTVGV